MTSFFLCQQEVILDIVDCYILGTLGSYSKDISKGIRCHAVPLVIVRLACYNFKTLVTFHDKSTSNK